MTDEIVLYKPNEHFQLEVQLKDETVWLTQQQIAVNSVCRFLLFLNIWQISSEKENWIKIQLFPLWKILP